MEHAQLAKNLQGIVYSEYPAVQRQGEQFMPEHCLSYLISGSVTVLNGNNTCTFKPGDYMYSPKNHLAKFIKHPPANGNYQSIAIIMDQDTLLDFYKEHAAHTAPGKIEKAVLQLPPNVLLENYFQSLLPYFKMDMPEPLILLKKREAILLLLQAQPALASLLFDFTAPGKIDLEAFMNQHFRYNVDMKKFAYLTGRSLATFKRDFEKVFHTTPNRWLQQKRLQEAYQLIKERGEKPSDVYLDVGFETLSHFSYSFKQFFGVNPSMV
ncbi:AraC-type DNA-binding protein [Chitinophaga rupis]|uniref:AraC-type DNA-binding protein n=1 Tax=Chitinophaga rupis TaxID=573321 RepID=A0A1H7S2G2_9BACT|nr:AraC family transcriptional regulator [Chitinophaga rupis]SEL66496.1 AraC-type DNA-binding protein [Chitinophaga rupis]